MGEARGVKFKILAQPLPKKTHTKMIALHLNYMNGSNIIIKISIKVSYFFFGLAKSPEAEYSQKHEMRGFETLGHFELPRAF